ncbi:Lon protease C-terminal proteolytic domain-containing protein [Russula aff. rugulosa BPL654]|nr:Lon protease C-terminal proteolytic domain-containing protein [Russula aff. rugulosa BPL654]
MPKSERNRYSCRRVLLEATKGEFPPKNAEHCVVRNYVRTFFFFPYPRIVSDNALSSNGLPALCLDADHLGLDKIQGPRKVAKTIKAPILSVSPPGMGKASLGQSIARALGRPFQRIALGGVLGPGLLAQASRKAGREDPIILFRDEIDKVGHHGDPAATLLDPEQNVAFNVWLIYILANTLDTIAPPLLDRCEVIQLSDYSLSLPERPAQSGLSEAHFQVTPALLSIASQCTCEVGIRALERAIGGVVPFRAVDDPIGALDKNAGDGDAGHGPVVEADELEKILGLSRHDREDRDREAKRGVVWGLVVTGIGEGDLMPVESIVMHENGNPKLIGSLDDRRARASWVKKLSYDLGITTKRVHDPLCIPDAMIDVHVHFPAGAQKNDGLGSGVAMVCVIVSLLTGMYVPPMTAMTGEITLRGQVSPVGGIKEKRYVEYEVDYAVKEVRMRIQFVFARTVHEVLDAAFGPGLLPWRAPDALRFRR